MTKLYERVFINWKKPNPDKEHDEIKYQHKVATGKAEPAPGSVGVRPKWVRKRLKELKKKKKWKDAFKAAKEVEFQPHHIKKVGWFGPTGDARQTWRHIISRKYFNQGDHENFKHVNTPYKINTAVKQRTAVRKPVVLRNPKTGEHWLIGGRHRMAYIGSRLRTPVVAHAVEDTAPTNSMGSSSSANGPIQTFNPILIKKKLKRFKDVINGYEKQYSK